MNRTWAEINLDNLKSNVKNIRAITSPKAGIMAVVKADAYGHGYEECCRALLDSGVDCFAVAMTDEAKLLRKSGFTVPILILGATLSDEDAEDIAEYDIMPTIYNVEYAKVVSKAAKEKGKTAKIHLKIDTGMSRLGFVAGEDNSEVVKEILEIYNLPNIEIHGIFSHFACADEPDDTYTKHQFKLFMKLVSDLEAVGIKIPCKHMANSAAITMYPETHLDMVRAGIILYGCYPSDDVDKNRLPLKPVMSLKSRITLVKEVEEGRGVSYGKKYITDKKTKIATVPIGYADGYPRCLSHKAKIEAGGKICDVIGRICMDQCMIDVTDVHNINIGDEVTVFGDGQISADDVAGWMDTINYEVLCLVSKRIPRIYKENGREVFAVNYLEKI